jgi:peroxidase
LKDNSDSFLRGLLNEPAAKYDSSFVDVLQNRLFESNSTEGLDLAAININRGRDHGIPGYNYFRRKCGLQFAESFDDLKDTIPVDTISILSTVYKYSITFFFGYEFYL